MTDIYNGIPNSSLQWLDRLSGKTGAELPVEAASAPQNWLPSEIASRLVSGKTYILTVGSEVLALTAPSTLTRGLEGTAAATHGAGTDVYQALTAHQLAWLVRQASKIPPAPEDMFGHYLGTLEQEGQDYWIFAAPPDAAATLAFKNSQTQTDSYNTESGAYNMLAIQYAGIADHPAAEYCANYRGGGYDDWYLPANAELSLFMDVRAELSEPYPSENLLSSTCPDSSSGLPGWFRNVYYMFRTGGLSNSGSKTLTYLAIPFRRVPAP